MTVLPVPVTTPEPPASDPPAHAAEPGFAEKLAQARNDGGTDAREADATREHSARIADQAKNATANDDPANDSGPPVMAATDAGVVAVLVALTRTAPVVAPEAPVTDAPVVELVDTAGSPDVLNPAPKLAVGNAGIATIDRTAAPTELAPATNAHPTAAPTELAPATNATILIEPDPAPDPTPGGAAPDGAAPDGAAVDETAPAPGKPAEAKHPPIAAPERSAAVPVAPGPAPAASDGAPQADVDGAAPLVGVATAAPAPRAEHAAAPAPVTTPAPAPPPLPADQLVSVMKPFQRDADGTYTLKLEMKPPELGRLELRIELRDGVMHASIRSEHAHTADLVRDALDDLRSRLEADGVSTGRLSVDDGRTGERDRDESQSNDSSETHESNTPVATPRPVDATRSDALVDVRV